MKGLAEASLGLGLALFLAGCASLGTAGVDRSARWPRHEAKMEAIRGFVMSGEIGVMDRGRGFTGSLAWRERGGQSLLLVQGPLGSGGFRLSGHPGRWLLVTSRGQRVEIRHGLRRALSRWFGIPVPVTSLGFWVLGLPDPRFPAEFSWTRKGRIDLLRQDRWKVALGRYLSIAGRALPTDLVLTHQAIRIHVRVTRWSIVRSHPDPTGRGPS